MPTIFPGALPNLPALWAGNYSPSSYATPLPAKSHTPSSPHASSYKTYDYIILGGGTAGCVLANRLSEDDPSCKVLLLEAGYDDSRQLFSRIPAGFAFLFKTKADWNYETVPQKQLNNRKLFWPR